MVANKKNSHTIVKTNLERVIAIIDCGLGGAYLVGPQKNKKIGIVPRDAAHQHFTSCMSGMYECPSCLLHILRDAENLMPEMSKRMLMNIMLELLE